MEENQLSPEIKTKILNFLKEVETTNIFAVDFKNSKLELGNVPPELICDLLNDENYSFDSDDKDGQIISYFFSKENHTYKNIYSNPNNELKNTDAIEIFYIKLVINYFEFDVKIEYQEY